MELVGEGIKFERIRRITGYLVGSTSRWSNAKRAEERERVKHVTNVSAKSWLESQEPQEEKRAA